MLLKYFHEMHTAELNHIQFQYWKIPIYFTHKTGPKDQYDLYLGTILSVTGTRSLETDGPAKMSLSFLCFFHQDHKSQTSKIIYFSYLFFFLTSIFPYSSRKAFFFVVKSEHQWEAVPEFIRKSYSQAEKHNI